MLKSAWPERGPDRARRRRQFMVAAISPPAASTRVPLLPHLSPDLPSATRRRYPPLCAVGRKPTRRTNRTRHWTPPSPVLHMPLSLSLPREIRRPRRPAATPTARRPLQHRRDARRHTSAAGHLTPTPVPHPGRPYPPVCDFRRPAHHCCCNNDAPSVVSPCYGLLACHLTVSSRPVPHPVRL